MMKGLILFIIICFGICLAGQPGTTELIRILAHAKRIDKFVDPSIQNFKALRSTKGALVASLEDIFTKVPKLIIAIEDLLALGKIKQKS